MGHRGNLIDVDLEEQIGALRREIGSIARALSKRGSSLYGGTAETLAEYVPDLSDYVPSVRTLRGGARRAGRMAYDHPAVVAAVGLVVVGLVASLMLTSRRQSPARRSGGEGGEAEQAASGEPTRRQD